MDNLKIIIPKEIEIGFQKRTDYDYTTRTQGPEYVLGFATFRDKGKLRKETSWNGWRNASLGIKKIDNKPRKGFMIADVKQRSRDWFGSGRNVWRIMDPDGFQLEITSENLQALICYCNIIEGEFSEAMVWGWSGAQMALICTNSDLYNQATANTERQKHKISIKNINPGNVVQLKNGQVVTYLGDYNSILTKQNYKNSEFNIEIKQSNLHYFLNNDNKWLVVLASPEIAYMKDVKVENKDILKTHIDKAIVKPRYQQQIQITGNYHLIALSEKEIDLTTSFKKQYFDETKAKELLDNTKFGDRVDCWVEGKQGLVHQITKTIYGKDPTKGQYQWSTYTPVITDKLIQLQQERQNYNSRQYWSTEQSRSIWDAFKPFPFNYSNCKIFDYVVEINSNFYKI